MPLGIGRVGFPPAGIAGARNYCPGRPTALCVPSAITGMFAPDPYLETSTERPHAHQAGRVRYRRSDGSRRPAAGRSSPVTDAESSYPLSTGLRIFSIVAPVFLVTIGVAVIVDSLRNSAGGPPLFFFLWTTYAAAQGLWMIFMVPQRIEVIEEGLRFVARMREVVIPWQSLRAVSAPRFDPNRQRLRWEWDDRRLRTWAAYKGLHRLLRIIEDRAPQAQIRNL